MLPEFLASLATRRYVPIEAVATTQQAGQFYKFQNQQLLQSVMGGQRVNIFAVTAYASNSVSVPPINQTNAMATVADVKGAFLTLQILGTERIKLFPLGQMMTIWTGDTDAAPFTIQPLVLTGVWGVDWTQSGVTTAAAAHAVNTSYVFGIWYDFSDDVITDNA